MSIQLCVDTNPIKLGSCVVRVSTTGNLSILNTHVIPSKNITDIQDSYATRWDDKNYYFGSGSINGGTYVGEGEINGGEA